MVNNAYIGVDLGTSSVKTILCTKNGSVIAETSMEYALITPQELFVEQNPKDWFNAVIITIQQILKNFNGKVEAISFSGQMHGLVMLDKRNKPLGNAILWNDQRSFKEVEKIKKDFKKSQLLNLTGNIPIEGFVLPKLLWLKKNKINLYQQMNKFLLPKDYLIFRLTNKFVTDVSDAAGTGMFNVKNKTWEKRIINFYKIKKDILPKVLESTDFVGKISKEIKEVLEINYDIKVIVGAGDQAANAIGLGVIKEGKMALSLGTSSCVFAASNNFIKNENLHSFNHANRKFHLMGVSQSGGGSMKWIYEEILGRKDFKSLEKIDFLNNNKIFFLPYLTGERHPIHDPLAKGVFVGLDRRTKDIDIVQSVLEGMAFAIKQIVDIISLKVKTTEILVAGGAGNNENWLKALSSLVNLKISIVKGNYGGALGAAIIAMVGSNTYKTFDQAFKEIIKIDKVFLPSEKIKDHLIKKYNLWIKIYPSIKPIFKLIHNMN